MNAPVEAETKPLRCSFCHKSQRDVKKLIAGPTVFICDEGVDVCNEILAGDGIPAGRGLKAAMRVAGQADEYLRMALDLANARNHLGAAREIRNAALAALRGIALLDSHEAANLSETKVVASALETDPEIARLLHDEDRAHVVLRVSVDGATLSAEDIQSASEVVTRLAALLRQKINSSQR